MTVFISNLLPFIGLKKKLVNRAFLTLDWHLTSYVNIFNRGVHIDEGFAQTTCSNLYEVLANCILWS